MAELYTRLLDIYYQDFARLEADLSSDVAIHENILDDARKHSSTSSKWNCMKAIAETNYRKQKKLVKQIWASACLSAAERLGKTEGKAPQHRVEWAAYNDPAYVSAEEALSKFGHVLDMIKGVQNSLWDKREMTSLLGKDEQRERFAAPRMAQTNYEQPEAPWSPRKSDMTEEELEELARQNIAKSKKGK